MPVTRPVVLVAALVALGPGCAADPEVQAGTVLELGLDVGGRFSPLADGDLVRLVRGPQGGFHLALAARSDAAQAAPAELGLRAVDAATGDEVARARYFVSFDGPSGETLREEPNLRLVVPSPEELAARPVVVTAELDQGDGLPLSDRRMVTCVPPTL